MPREATSHIIKVPVDPAEGESRVRGTLPVLASLVQAGPGSKHNASGKEGTEGTSNRLAHDNTQL